MSTSDQEGYIPHGMNAAQFQCYKGADKRAKMFRYKLISLSPNIEIKGLYY